MSKEEILNHHYVHGKGLVNPTQYVLDAMDEYAKQQALSVINEIENEWNGYESLPADYAINLIKKQFNIV